METSVVPPFFPPNSKDSIGPPLLFPSPQLAGGLRQGARDNGLAPEAAAPGGVGDEGEGRGVSLGTSGAGGLGEDVGVV
jgi:hypothetical protein